MTQYVTVKFNNKTRSMYTYRNNGAPVSTGSDVWVKSITGPRPVEVIHTSNKPPSKDPSPDGYRGRAGTKILRKG